MKKLFYTLLFIPITLFGQITPNMFSQPANTGANMTIGINDPSFDIFAGGGKIGAFYDLNGDGNLVCVGLEIIQLGFFGMAIWGDDLSTNELDGLPCGGFPYFFVLFEGYVFPIDLNVSMLNEEDTYLTCGDPNTDYFCEFELGYCTNFIAMVTNSNISLTGCTDPAAENYYPYATIDDGSCLYPDGCYYDGQYYSSDEFFHCACWCDNGSVICLAVECGGCYDQNACNYGEVTYDVYFDFDICEYPQLGYDCNGNCILDIDNDGICDPEEILGCQDSNACNFNLYATDSGDCIYPYGCDSCSGEIDGSGYVIDLDYDNDSICDSDEILGCQDPAACNFNILATDQDTCVFASYGYDCFNNCLSDDDDDGFCDSFELEECLEYLSNNFNIEATFDNCITSFASIIDSLETNLSSMSLNFQDSISVLLTNIDSINSEFLNQIIEYDIQYIDWIYSNEYLIDSLQDEAQFYQSIFGHEVQNYYSEYQSDINLSKNIIDSIIQSYFSNQNLLINLQSGWNMFGYSCPEPINLIEGLFNHTESIIITKDNNGNVYMPEFGFNGIGNFTPGFGYQIKVTEDIDGFGLCDWYLEDIPNDIFSFLYDSIYSTNNDYQVGNYHEGGIIFWIDESQQYGLIAALHDLPGYYKWGCVDTNYNNENIYTIGTGYQNTINIIQSNCVPEFGYYNHSNVLNLSAAKAALNYQNNGFSDWYLPSLPELQEINNTIGFAGDMGNLVGLDIGSYWSSSGALNSNGSYGAYTFQTSSNSVGEAVNWYPCKVRPIRTFYIGEQSDSVYNNLVLGCSDVNSCNFNDLAQIDDGSCYYDYGCGCGNPQPDSGYDCDGNLLQYQIGDFSQGGIIFYVDSSGNHGLVAAIEDLTVGGSDPWGSGSYRYEWGCYQENITGAYGKDIGTGFQNTLDIVSDCSELNTAARSALDYENFGYKDWYLPSKNELIEMSLSIGYNQDNIGGFHLNSGPQYWSSSQENNFHAWFVNFGSSTGSSFEQNKTNIYRVRPIRSF